MVTGPLPDCCCHRSTKSITSKRSVFDSGKASFSGQLVKWNCFTVTEFLGWKIYNRCEILKEHFSWNGNSTCSGLHSLKPLSKQRTTRIIYHGSDICNANTMEQLIETYLTTVNYTEVPDCYSWSNTVFFFFYQSHC